MSGALSGFGVLAAAGAASAAILLPAGRLRSLALLAAILLCPIVILGDQWDSTQIADLREAPMRLVGLALLALAITATLALAFLRWPLAFPLAAVAVLPFRVPLEAGGDTANLLVPLYLVIAGGVVSAAVRAWPLFPRVASGEGGRGRPRPQRPPLPMTGPAGGGSPAATGPAGRNTQFAAVRWLPRIVAAVVLLYAAQTLYSPDFSKSLQSVCFFFVPFAVLYALLREVEWSRRLLHLVLLVVALEAVVFVAIGTVEWFVRELFWNDQVIRSNDFHTYFRVNSVFWDPNIYGRYLALVATIAMTALLWAKERKSFWLLTGLIAVLWIGLVPTYSQSSFAALLGGLAVLAALRWSRRWTLAAVGAAAVFGVLVVLFAGGASKLSPSRLNVDTGGRANLVSGGLELFKQRPGWGYGSGSFPKAYTEHIKSDSPVSASHTQPITVAAEQGVVGLALYGALLVAAIWTMASGVFSTRAGPVAAGDPPPPAVAEASSGAVPPTTPPARAAILAAFVALLVHTMAYAGFYEDPIAWVLLAVGASLALIPVRDGT